MSSSNARSAKAQSPKDELAEKKNEISEQRKKRQQEREKRLLKKEKTKAKQGSIRAFIDRIFEHPILKWVGYLVLLLILAGLLLIGYVVYKYVMANQDTLLGGDLNVRENFIEGLKATFAPEHMFSLYFISDIASPLVFLIVVALSAHDQVSFVRKRHVDHKSLIVSMGVLGTFVGIFVGLYYFDVSDIEGSVPVFLAGLKTAFLTSILALLFSGILTFIQSRANVGAEDELETLHEMSESLLALDESQTLMEIQQRTLSAIEKQTRQFNEEAKNQSDSMKSLIEEVRRLQSKINTAPAQSNRQGSNESWGSDPSSSTSQDPLTDRNKAQKDLRHDPFA